MIANLKPYPKMKDSGLPWLGNLPAHWNLERAKWLFKKMARPSRDADEVVTCFRDGTVTLRKNRRVRGFTESLKEIGYQGIRRGDLVIHAMDAFAGAIGVADSDGKGTPVYSVCKPVDRANSHYYAYLLREMSRAQWIQALAKGIRERSTDFRFEDFGSQLVPVPPLREQAAIVRFLDYADRRIQRYVRAKQKLIKLLEEQKQAIINRAVTRGLDPNVRLKPSGVEGWDDVPEHWQVVALKRTCSLLRDGTHLPPPRTSSGVPLLSVRNIVANRFVRRVDDSMITNADYEQLSRSFAPHENDVLLAIVGATLGKVAIVPLMERFQIQRSLAIFRPKPDKLSFQFLAALLQSPSFQNALWTTVAFSAQPGIYLNTLANFRVQLPPLDEQVQIISELDGQIVVLEAAIGTVSRQVSLLGEYRTRLIADVVTGKLDVREAALQLHEETEDAEKFEETNAEITSEADETDAMEETLESI